MATKQKVSERNRILFRKTPKGWRGYIKTEFKCGAMASYNFGCRCKKCKKVYYGYQVRWESARVDARGRCHLYYPEVQEHLKFLYEKGISFRKMSVEIGVSESSLYRLKKTNVKTSKDASMRILGIGIHRKELMRESPR